MHKTAGERLEHFTTGCQGPSAQLQNFAAISGNHTFGHFIILEVGKSKDGLQGMCCGQGFPKRDVARTLRCAHQAAGMRPQVFNF